MSDRHASAIERLIRFGSSEELRAALRARAKASAEPGKASEPATPQLESLWHAVREESQLVQGADPEAWRAWRNEFERGVRRWDALALALLAGRSDQAKVLVDEGLAPRESSQWEDLVRELGRLRGMPKGLRAALDLPGGPQEFAAVEWAELQSVVPKAVVRHRILKD